jgi:CubicO group peptidase (beta-lactamase class C family)
MKFSYALVFMFAGLFAKSSEMFCSQPSEPVHAALDKIVRQYYDEGKFNGSIIVADNSGIIYEKILGYRDIDKKKELKDETLLGLASVSKIFTSTAVMKLVQTGKISLDESIRKYLPDLPEFYNTLSVKNLLTHTSGITDCLTAPVYEVHNEDIYSFVKKQKELEFTPGTQYKYCNTAYVLLAMIIKKASGESYREYMDKNIFSLCGMENTVAGRDLSDKKFARSYHISGSVDDRTNYYYGPGEIYTTAKDLYKFDRAYFSGKVLKPGLVEEVLQRNTLDDGTYTNYGLGWGVYKKGDEYLLGHTGGNYGFRSLYEHQKKSGLTIIILSNIGDKTPVMEIRDTIVNVLKN